MPEGVSPRDVILFIGNDGHWWAENPSPEILEEIKQWRSDWSKKALTEKTAGFGGF